jgi:hypothetical protein
MIIWSDDILRKLEKAYNCAKVIVKIGNELYPIIGLEDSQSIGWWEIRFDPDLETARSIDVEYLRSNLPKGEMVMLQERTHLGKSYPIIKVVQNYLDLWILECDDPTLEYWEELEKWNKLNL